MSPPAQCRAACAAGATALGGLTAVALLRRMRAELLGSGRLSAPTVASMYAVYGGHALVTAWTLGRRSGERPPSATLVRCGGAIALCGTGLFVASARRFTPGQLSGTDPGVQITGGVHRHSRNPQYTGYLLVLAGLALARRSATAGLLTGAVAAAYRWWVPVEEAHLETEFGVDYRDYRDRTPRWFGLPGRRRDGAAAARPTATDEVVRASPRE